MKRAYVGLSTPIGYDYINPIQPRTKSQRDVPNPILENTTGLLVCYDELWFPERDFCPLDMQGLPYVKFISDYPDLLDRAVVAQEQFYAVSLGDAPALDPTDNYGEKLEHIRGAVPFNLSIDNHSRGGGVFGMGNAGDPGLFVQDIGIATAIDMDLDIVMSSRLMPHEEQRGAPALIGSQPWKLDAAELITGVRTIDWLGPRGAYHESIEDLRIHPRVREFREYLTAAVEPSSDATRLTETVNDLVDKHARDVMEKYLRGRGLVRTIGTAGVGGVGNLIQPGLGTALTAVVNSAAWLKERSQRKRVSWSLFVLDARRMRRLS